MKKYSTILFDMDGTLVNTDELIVQTMLELYRLYRVGLPTPREQIYYFSGPPIRETLKKEFPDKDNQFMWDEFHRISWEYYPKYITSYPNCKEMLLELKNKGYKLGIVTNKIHKTTQYCLEILGFDGIFDSIIGFDDVSVGKPNKEGMLKAMNLCGETDTNKVLYVGDNESDLVTSNNSNVDCMLIGWGPRKLREDLNPKYKIRNFNELVGVIEHE